MTLQMKVVVKMEANINGNACKKLILTLSAVNLNPLDLHLTSCRRLKPKLRRDIVSMKFKEEELVAQTMKT